MITVRAGLEPDLLHRDPDARRFFCVLFHSLKRNERVGLRVDTSSRHVLKLPTLRVIEPFPTPLYDCILFPKPCEETNHGRCERKSEEPYHGNIREGVVEGIA